MNRVKMEMVEQASYRIEALAQLLASNADAEVMGHLNLVSPGQREIVCELIVELASGIAELAEEMQS
jgi:hypothetical protein